MRRFFILCILLAPSLSGAGGYALYEMNAAAAAMGHAYICRVDDPSAVWYNPAALSRIEDTELSLSSTWINTSSEFTPLFGSSTIQGVEGNFFPTNIFVAHPLSEEMVLAFGVYNAFGLKTEWPLNSQASFVSRKAQLRTLFFTPSIGFKMNSNLSVGGGLDFVYADINLERNISLLPLSNTIIFNEVKADGFNFGFNLGILFEKYKNWTLAATYKHKIDIDFTGDVSFDGVPPIFTTLFPDGDAAVEIPLPAQLMLGASTTQGDWSYEANVIWTRWSVLKRIDLNFDENTPALADVSIRRDYDNSWSLRFGTEYLLSDRLALRAGYYFDKTPVPDQAVDPILPDGNRNSISLGFAYDFGSYHFDTAYTALFFNSRTSPINNFYDPPANLAAAGDYDIFVNLLSIGFGYQF